jgi:membrane-associated phospholipid phosphatase
VVSDILDAGVELIQWLEAYRTPALTLFVLIVTDVGSTVGYLLMLPVIWWGFSWKVGARIFVALVLSVYINSLVKEVFALPRPFHYSPDLVNLRTPDDFSFPSGHAQQAALFWGLLALHFRKRWFTALAVLMILLIGFSRVYLGVHFPSDVVVGWTLGVAIALGFIRWSGAVVEWGGGLALSSQVLLALGVPALLAVANPSQNAAIAMGGLAGALGGLAFGYHRGLYPQGELSHHRRAWLTVGLAGLPILYFALRALSPGSDSLYYHLYLWARFATIGLWVSFLVPRIVSTARRRRAASS